MLIVLIFEIFSYTSSRIPSSVRLSGPVWSDSSADRFFGSTPWCVAGEPWCLIWLWPNKTPPNPPWILGGWHVFCSTIVPLPIGRMCWSHSHVSTSRVSAAPHWPSFRNVSDRWRELFRCFLGIPLKIRRFRSKMSIKSRADGKSFGLGTDFQEVWHKRHFQGTDWKHICTGTSPQPSRRLGESIKVCTVPVNKWIQKIIWETNRSHRKL